MTPIKVYRFSGIGALFGYLLLIPSVPIFISSLVMCHSLGDESGAGVGGWGVIVMLAIGGIGIGAELIKKKTVASCPRCKAERSA